MKKIKLEALDPTGVVVSKPLEFGFEELVTEDKEGFFVQIKQTPMKRVRYILTVCDYKYLINENGEITEQIEPALSFDQEKFPTRKFFYKIPIGNSGKKWWEFWKK
jgi:hypothetical protein